MKNQPSKSLGLLLLFILSSAKVVCQSGTGEMDRVFDRFGNPYFLSNLSTSSSRPIGGGNSYSINATTQFCTAGYFDLYYETGCFFDGNTNAQTVACEVFRNLSGLINSALTGTNTVKIYLRNMATTTVTPPPLGQGSAFYMVPIPNQPYNSNPGIVENVVYKTITSGVDAFTNLPSTMFVSANSNGFFHGIININASVQWYTGIGTSTVSTDYDLYSVLLHEAIHMLGFSSLINSNGVSQFGSSLNYYSSFDKFLYNSAGLPLITTSTQSTCPNSGNAFTLSTTNIAPGTCPSSITNSTTCSSAVQYSSANTGTIAIYTPNCFELGSSLCHFEDLCSVPSSFTATSSCYSAAGNSNNDLYWTMSNANGTGSCYVKRYPKPLERLVLCDLGYNVNTTYTSNASAASFTYGGSACPGKNIWGVNDGFNGSIYTLTTTASAISIPTTAIAANDASTTVQLSCLDVIYNNATASISGGSLVVTANTGYHGLVLVKYLPENSSGQQGNPTYIYIYFVPTGCGPSGMCNLIQNGGFESVVYGSGCSQFITGPTNLPLQAFSSLPGCWESYEGQPDIFERNCTTTATPNYNLGINTLGTGMDSYNGSPNNHIVGLTMANIGAVNTSNNSVNPPTTESLKNNLASSLIPGQPYRVSFLVSNFSGTLTGYNNFNVPSYVNPGAQPIVITVASAPVYNIPTIGGFPTGLNVLAQFTIAANTTTASPWTAITQTFVFSPTVSVNHSAIVIGGNVSLTFPSASTLNTAYCLIDEVSIQALPNPTFSIPTAQNCGNATYTNLIQYATGTGTFTGANVTLNSTQYNFNTSQTLASGSYPVAYASSNGTCINTVWQNIKVTFPYTLTPSTNTINCANYNTSFTLNTSTTPSLSGLNFSWQPGNLSGASQVVTQTTSAIYTVTSTDPAGCTATQTLAVIVPTNCCSSPNLAVFSATTVPTGTSISGPMLISSDFTIQPGASFVFGPGEYVFTQNARVVVSNSASVWMAGAHLYSCGADLWQGIVVKDGGQVFSVANSGNDVLIEDAITAIDASNQATTTINAFNISNTIFNKNYIDVKIGNYSVNSGSYNASVFGISNCVFSCRDFTFSSNSWPGVSTSSGGLRFAASSTTGLAPPYNLQNAAIVNLKSPYNSQRSFAAIQVVNCGQTNTLYPVSSIFSFSGIKIGDDSNPSNFLLFDAHESFIDVNSSNLKVVNSVFQNTQTYSVTQIRSAIQHTSGIFNSELDLRASNQSTGLRFYDCHRAVQINNAYKFHLSKAIIRSTQSYTAISSSTYAAVGQDAVRINTNRFEDYNIFDNEITNICNAIGVVCAPATFSCSGFGFYPGPPPIYPTLIYVRNMSVDNNTISPTGSTAFTGTTSNYVDYGIIITSIPSYTVWGTWASPGIMISNNKIYRVNHGISINELNSIGIGNHVDGPPKTIRGNVITLQEDNYWNSTQHGIEITNSMAPPAGFPTFTTQGLQTIETNTLNVHLAPTTNTNLALVYCFGNGGTGTLMPSPYIICNTLSDVNKGFEFENYNQPTYWRNNYMSNMSNGMMLNNGGRIGQQGTSTSPSDNQWTGSWSGNISLNTSGGSISQLSPLCIRNGANLNPPTFGGNSPNPAWYNQTGGTLTATGAYTCGAGYSQFVALPPNGGDYDDENVLYIANTHAFRSLHLNDSMKMVDPDLLMFYNSFAGTSIDLFLQIEAKFAVNDFTGAQTTLNGIDRTGFNNVEQNYADFYQLYINYFTNDSLTDSEKTTLQHIAGYCPGTDGAAVYQARALRQWMGEQYLHYYDNCGTAGARQGEGAESNNKKRLVSERWNVELFPNPASNALTITSKNENEMLNIEIKDITGRVLIQRDLKTTGFIANLELPIINGAYFITIKNGNNESVTKTLLIAR